MSPTPELAGGHDVHVMFTPQKSPSPSVNRKGSPSMIGGCRRVTPSKSGRKTPPRANKTSAPVTGSLTANVNVETANNGPSVEKRENSFQDHKELCDRVAKSLYFANKLPTTPRPSLPLTKLAVSTFSKKARQDTLEFLDLEQAAEIGRNACISPTALIMSIVYLERLSATNPGYLGSIKPSELFVVSLLVASKFIQDDGEELGIFNDEWATSANLELKQLNRMELQFLSAIDWKVKVDPDDYSRVLEWFEKEVAMEEGGRRGWFTYSEVTTLLSFHLLWPTIYQHCVKAITAACLTYATLLATLLATSSLGPQVFMMSKTCLTALTATGPSYQPFSDCSYNSTRKIFRHKNLGQGNPSLPYDQEDDQTIENMMNLDVDGDGHEESTPWLWVTNGNGTESGNKGNMVARSKHWARPGWKHDPGQHSTPQHQKNYGLNQESLLIHELQRLFQNHNEEQQKTDIFTSKCYPKARDTGQYEHMGRCLDTHSQLKNDRLYSSFRHSLPNAKLIRV